MYSIVHRSNRFLTVFPQ